MYWGWTNSGYSYKKIPSVVLHTSGSGPEGSFYMMSCMQGVCSDPLKQCASHWIWICTGNDRFSGQWDTGLLLFTGFEDTTALQDKKGLTIFSAKLVVDCTTYEGSLGQRNPCDPVSRSSHLFLFGLCYVPRPHSVQPGELILAMTNTT